MEHKTTSSLMNKNKLNIVSSNIPQMKYLSLQEYQQLCLDLEKACREIMNLNQKLCHARRNLEDEKRKCRVIEHHKNLLERQINTAREMLFNNKEANLDEVMKEKLQFLNNRIEIKYNNLYVQGKQGDRHLTTIMETDSTGSILSDLNYLSKSEDDLDTDAIIKSQKEKEWKEYKPSKPSEPSEPCSTLDKVAEFYSSSGATTTRVKPNDEIHATPLKAQIASNKENTGSKLFNTATNHNFVSKIVIKPETCIPCGKRIRFGKVVIKCKDCLVTFHTECKINVLSLPCGRKSTLSVSTTIYNNGNVAESQHYLLPESKTDT